MKRLSYISKLLMVSLTVLFLGMYLSCNDDDGVSPPLGSGNQWTTISLSTQYQVPKVPDRQETGTLRMKILNNTLYYEISVNNLSGTDALTMAHFHTGDALTNGPIIFDFEPEFGADGTAIGSVPIRQTLVDSLSDGTNEIYFNIHSTEAPTGLIRGQINSRIVLAADVVMTGDNQVPAVSTTATGLAILRLTADGRLFSNITVSDLEVGDILEMAHIHLGAAGVNGDIFIPLCETAADFGISKIQLLSNETITTLLGSNAYVNVHTTNFPSGIIRGQLDAVVDPITDPVDPPTEPGPYGR